MFKLFSNIRIYKYKTLISFIDISICKTENYLIIDSKSKLMKMLVYNQKYQRELPGHMVWWLAHPGEQNDAGSSHCGSSEVLRQVNL